MSRKSKDLAALIAQLHALIAGNDIRPDQKRHVEAVLKEVQWLRRKNEPAQREVYRCVRIIAEKLMAAFRRY